MEPCSIKAERVRNVVGVNIIGHRTRNPSPNEVSQKYNTYKQDIEHQRAWSIVTDEDKS